MKLFRLLSITLLITSHIYGYNSALLYHLQTIQTESLFAQNESFGKTTKKAFQTFYKISKNAGPIELLRQENIFNLFLLTPHKDLNDQFNVSLKNVQNIMLVYLYSKIFQEYITKTQTLIEESLCALQYWQTEKFYDQLPTLRKHPVYWYHSPAHKKLICNHVKALKAVTDQATLLLGIALHGQYQLNQIQDNADLLPQLTKACDPLLKHFQTISLPDATMPEAMLQNTIWLHENIQIILQNHQEQLLKHAKPHHIIRHGFLYSCMALAAIGTYAVYKSNESDIPEYQQKTSEAFNYFLSEYVQIPLQKLKETLWDKKTIKIQQMGELAPLQPSEPITLTVKSQPFKIPMIRYPVEIPTITVNIPSNEINGIKETFNQNKAELRSCFNNNVEMITLLAKDQQLTLVIVAIAPAILGSLGIFYGTKHLYNKYIQHESWYKPMQRIVREIDQTLNRLTSQENVSFADDGMLYILTHRLKTYVSCLNNEELELIQQDLLELSAYHLNYQQKRGVLERMYRTYSFLR